VAAATAPVASKPAPAKKEEKKQVEEEHQPAAVTKKESHASIAKPATPPKPKQEAPKP
jgi:hypothetical protein